MMRLLGSRVIINGVTITDIRASHLFKGTFLLLLVGNMLVLVLVLLRMMMLLDSRVIINVTITDIRASHFSKGTLWLLLVCMTLLW